MRLLISFLAIALVGCDAARQETGGFTAIFKSIEDAEESHDHGTIELNVPAGKVSLRPRRVPRLFEHEKTHVEYIVSIDLKSNWKIDNDDDFRSLVNPNLKPVPVDINAIRIHGVRYVNRPVGRSKDIADFYDRLSDRGTGGWSAKEIQLLLPVDEKLPPIPIDSQRHKLWLDWPNDDRQLFLDFEYDEDKREQILVGCGLNYPE